MHLSTMTCDFLLRPFSGDGSTEIRNSGLSHRSLVTGKTVSEGWAEKKSD